MPKITTWQGPSHVDLDGNPVVGPVGTQIQPTEPDEQVQLDRHPDEPQDEPKPPTAPARTSSRRPAGGKATA